MSFKVIVLFHLADDKLFGEVVRSIGGKNVVEEQVYCSSTTMG